MELPNHCSFDSFSPNNRLLYSYETRGDFTRWCQLGDLWTFVALHSAFRLIHAPLTLLLLQNTREISS